MQELPLFPTMFYETYIEPSLAFQVLDEIKSKQNLIDTVSEASQPHPVNDYSTDYTHPIQIEMFWNEVVPLLCEEFKQLNYNLNVLHSWVASYFGPGGHHPLHNHESGYSGNINYSGILYLSDIGATDFFAASVTSRNYMYSSPSKVGKIVLFPSIIPHQYRPERYDGNARYVLPFNCEMQNI